MSTSATKLAGQPAVHSLLIFDPNKEEISGLAQIFEPDGYAINTATTNPQALAMASLMSPDLIIFGPSLPEKEYADVCRQVRIDPLLRDIPLICIARLDDTAARLRALELGADDIFHQPLDARELRTRVRNIILQDRPRRLAAQRLEYERAQSEMESALDAILEKWALSQEMLGIEAIGHTRRVTDLTAAVAQKMDFPEEDVAILRRGAILHDIGRTACEADDLLEWERLPSRQKAAIRQHPLRAQEILWSIPLLRPALAIPMHHHERWDGTGFPNGLQGELIPLPARIFAVVDVWDELCSGHPSRPPWQPAQALAYIRAQSGKWFDPAVVEAFLKVVAERPVNTDPPLPRQTDALERAAKKQLKRFSSFSLSRRGAWMQLAVSAFLITVLPMLILVWLWQFDTTSGGVSGPFAAGVIVATLGIMTAGYILLGRYRFNIVRLRHYLHTLANGEIPMRVKLSEDSDDLIAMQQDMADIVRQAADRIRTIMEQQQRLLHAERQRVMIESLTSLCHHLGQPAGMLATHLQMLQQQAQSPEMQESVRECQQSFAVVQDILNRLQRVVLYRTEPYLEPEGGDNAQPDAVPTSTNV